MLRKGGRRSEEKRILPPDDNPATLNRLSPLVLRRQDPLLFKCNYRLICISPALFPKNITLAFPGYGYIANLFEY